MRVIVNAHDVETGLRYEVTDRDEVRSALPVVPGDVLRGKDGSSLTVLRVDVDETAETEVWNLDVAVTHGKS